AREYLENFYDHVVQLFREKGLEVETSPFCRIKNEFEQAVRAFEDAGVDALVTLHMAYSPSLESLDVLLKTDLPIIILDTTPTLEFTQTQSPVHIDYCHGIHGVMDMCSMLKRYGKPYAIAAGHYTESDCMDRVCGYVRAAVAARSLSRQKVGLVGGSFDGMGDFAVDPAEMQQRFGVVIENVSGETLEAIGADITEADILEEKARDRQMYTFSDTVVEEEYTKSVKGCLQIRKLLEQKGYSAFSVNFLNIAGLESMPFMEACKAMERGIGYAGEGDGLTSAFTGALLSAYPETSFVEIFCPDWKNNTLFLSHMGEMNYRIADMPPVVTRTGVNFTCGSQPYVGYCRMKKGKGVYVNVSRGPEDYELLLASCEMQAYGPDNFPTSMRGWMKPENMSTAQFLEELSKNGATHHSSFVYGATVEELEFFGKLLSMKTVVL
ncbi:MAG: hypothetical protein IKV57_05580, partial [Clostridia bacterium]|nr:hypothetical protein [Clostridia bacterium]